MHEENAAKTSNQNKTFGDIQRLCLRLFDRFLLEQLVLDRYMRYVLIVYPVVIWALSGNMAKNFHSNSPNGNGVFIGESGMTRKNFFCVPPQLNELLSS